MLRGVRYLRRVEFDERRAAVDAGAARAVALRTRHALRGRQRPAPLRAARASGSWRVRRPERFANAHPRDVHGAESDAEPAAGGAAEAESEAEAEEQSADVRV